MRKKFLSLATFSYKDEPFMTGIALLTKSYIHCVLHGKCVAGADFIATLSCDRPVEEGEMEALTQEEYTRLMENASRYNRVYNRVQTQS